MWMWCVRRRRYKSDSMKARKRLTEKELSEPIAPYLGDAYIALTSVVQGVALAALLYVTSEMLKNMEVITISTIPWVFVGKAMVVLALIILMWHRYVVHNQYNVGRFECRDTAIPILFSALQVALALSLSSQPFWFPAWMTLICLTGVAAYHNLIRRYDKSATRRVFKEHYRSETNNFQKHIQDEIQIFQRLNMRIFSICAVINLAVAYFCYFPQDGWSDGWKFFLAAFVAALIITLRPQHNLPLSN